MLADANTMIGRVSAGLLGALFVVWGAWSLRRYLRHYYPRRPK